LRALELQSIEFSYKDNQILKGISLWVDKGEIVGLLGPNGAGKSTTISICATLLKPSGGNVIYFGKKPREDYSDVRPLIGLVPQEVALYGDLSIEENLQFFGRLYNLRGSNLKTRIKDAASMVELSLGESKKVKELSGGNKRRLNIAAALLNNPEILIMDEPTVGIDLQSRKCILEAVKELRKVGTSILYATHYTDEIFSICSRMIIMNDGKVVANKTRAQLEALSSNSLSLENQLMELMFK
jgi:ABC-2 type transport system ATP-binding protein